MSYFSSFPYMLKCHVTFHIFPLHVESFNTTCCDKWSSKKSRWHLKPHIFRSSIQRLPRLSSEITGQEIDKRSNADVGLELNNRSSCEANSVRWYGHALRKDKNNFLRRALGFKVKGTRKRGRPKKTKMEIWGEYCFSNDDVNTATSVIWRLNRI